MEKPKGMDDMFDYDEYRAYIESRTWDEKRTDRYLFDDFACQLCGNRNNVQVHHLVYPLHKNFGSETRSELITVCPACHRLIDNLRKGQEVKINKLYGYKKRIECEIRFETVKELVAALMYLNTNHYVNSGKIPLYLYAEDKCRIEHISMKSYIELREYYGADRIQISIEEV